ncbi:DUF1330 domain-containing protein [Sulfitobacter sp. HNIBRBA3233]|uniref:DUF1330 domain-containing protein n=1 Tax=Sulfitobacter marinivivus TaxID=3158558 RepID=UPI0032DEB4BC
MPKGYLIGHIDVHDSAAFEEFKTMSGAAIKAHNGRVLIRNPDPEVLEGEVRKLTIVVEFDNIEAARTFYHSDAYTQARQLREKASDTDLMLVEGI